MDFIYVSLYALRSWGTSKTRAIYVWDIRSNPITYDFLFAVLQASHYFLSRGFPSFEIIIYAPRDCTVPSGPRGYRDFVSSSNIRCRVDDLIIPCARSLSCVSGVSIVDRCADLARYLNDNESIVFPVGYGLSYYPCSLSYKYVFSVLRSESLSLINFPWFRPTVVSASTTANANTSRYSCVQPSADLIVKGSWPDYMVLTLRDYGFSPERNTMQYDIEMIYDFCKYLGVRLVVVPDDVGHLASYSLHSDITVHIQSRFCLQRRASLYASAPCNFFVPSGPAALSLFIESSKTIYLDFGACGSDGNKEYYRSNFGIDEPDQPFLRLHGYLMWAKKRHLYSLSDISNAYDRLLVS